MSRNQLNLQKTLNMRRKRSGARPQLGLTLETINLSRAVGDRMLVRVYPGIYQFIFVAMILAASGISRLVVTLLLRTRAFAPAAQLTLRPRGAAAAAP